VARAVRVDFEGSARDVKRAGREAEGAIRGVSRTGARASKGVDAVGKSLDRTKKSVVGFGNATNLAFGAAGLAYGINSTIKAFKEAEKQTAKVKASLATLGLANESVQKKIERVTLAQQELSGFADDELQGSFATLVRSTGDVDEALKSNALAMDIARARGVDLNTVGNVLAKVYDGNVGILKRYGVAVEKDATIQEALAAAQKRYAGQAKAYGDTTSGAADKASQSFDNLQESLGKAFVPALNATSGALLSVTGNAQSLVGAIGGIGPVVAGAGGFGAFTLAAPVVSKFGGFLGTIATNARLGGGGVRGLGAAVGASVSPMGLAAVGAGLLAAGIYTIWQNSENADQAVQGLNKTLAGTAGARDQAVVAKNNVNAARDYVVATKAAESATRANARAKHGLVVEAQKELDALKAKHADSGKIVAAENKLAGATKDWGKAMRDVVPTVHARETAETSLTTAQKNLLLSQDGVNAALEKQDRKSRDVIAKAKEEAAIISGTAGRYGHMGDVFNSTALQAERFASRMDKAARATARTDRQTSIADRNLAGFARSIGRLPTVREIRIVTKLSQQGLTLAEIQRRLDRMKSKAITVKFNQTFGTRVDPLTGLKATTTTKKPAPRIPFKNAGAGGAWVSGRYGDGDRHLALVAGEEAILNPGQIDEVGRDRVMHALRDAPTIGGFAKGKAPRARDGRYSTNFGGFRRRGGHWSAWGGSAGYQRMPDGMGPTGLRSWLEGNLMGRGLSRAVVEDYVAWWSRHYENGRIYADPTEAFAKGKVPDRGKRLSSSANAPKPPSAAARARAVIARRKTFFDLALARADQALANAGGTDPTDDDVAALNSDMEQRRAYRDWLGKLLRNPARATGIPGARLTAAERTELIGEQTAQTRGINDDARDVWDLLHPEADAAAAAAGEEAAAAAEAGPTPDQEAIAQQLRDRLAAATRHAAVSEAELGALRSSGDIGTGGFTTALGAGAAILVTLGDQRSLAAVAGMAAAGFSAQPTVSASRERIGV